MKPLLFAILALFPTIASARGVELECEPGVKISLVSRWLGSNLLRLEGGMNWELPWTGHESVTPGQQLRADRQHELEQAGESPQDDELLLSVPESTRFATFRTTSASGPSPLSNMLYVDQDLLKGGEGDGLVIAVQEQQLQISGGIRSSVKVLHCRSR